MTSQAQPVRVIVRLRSLAPGMLMNNPPRESLDMLPGGIMEGKLPDDFDPETPLHRTTRIDHILPRDRQVGERILEALSKLDPGVEAPIGSDDDEALHVGEKLAMAKMHQMDGAIGLPGELVMAALVRAGSKVKHGRRAMTSKVSTSVPGLVNLDFVFAPLYVDGGESGKVPWKPFTIPGRAPKLKGVRVRRPIAITRPRIPHWKCEFTLGFDRRRVSPETIFRLVEVAGRDVGFGDFRPGLGTGTTTAGKFGRFVIDQFDMV